MHINNKHLGSWRKGVVLRNEAIMVLLRYARVGTRERELGE
jgi:hypothetical protein